MDPLPRCGRSQRHRTTERALPTSVLRARRRRPLATRGRAAARVNHPWAAAARIRHRAPPRSAARVVASVAHDATTQAIVKTRMAATYSRRWHHGRNSLKEMAPAASMLKIRVHQKHRSQGQRKASRVVAQSRAGALETSIKLQLIDHLRRRCGFGLISQTSPNSVRANSRVQNEPCKRCVRPD